jgi:heme/copper-type cytochrome/quinol oxidase subunit 1
MGLAYLYRYVKQDAFGLSDSGGTVSGALLYDQENTHPVLQDFKAPKIQLYLLTIGQILHITGLGMAGGYGVLRKTPGEEIAMSAKIYMGMVGIGGLIAIIGGLMFVYICAKRLIPNHFSND